MIYTATIDNATYKYKEVGVERGEPVWEVIGEKANEYTHETAVLMISAEWHLINNGE